MDLTWDRLKSPLTALALGILPFWVFAGTSGRTVINGRVVSDWSFNILGLVMVAIGIVMAFRVLRDDTGRPRVLPRTLLAVAAILVCILQLGLCAGLFRMEDIRAAFGGAVT